jgi:alanyl-tRNA synthetase
MEEKKFKGGLVDDSIETVRLHTATHILYAVLKDMFGADIIFPKGTNITPERARFDFSFQRKLTEEEILEIERKVNDIIKQEIDVTMEEKTLEEAKKEGIAVLFGDRYGEMVKIYTIGNISRELCGGPHVQNTKELGTFKIIKEEGSSAGVRRIKAILV